MKIRYLIVLLNGGDVRYRIEEFMSMRECHEFQAAITEIIRNDAPDAKIVRSECFEVGQVVSK